MQQNSPFKPDDLIGEHYRVEREIGHGGMATVFLCTDVRDASRAAVKVLRPELGSVVTRRRFLREIALGANLDHPRIPRILESGATATVSFYAMEFVDGESLRERLARVGRLTLEETVRIAAAIADPMHFAHARRIVHRDIKPDNILLSGDAVYVLDFGVARALIDAAGDRLTGTGITVGTPAYMSPEQVTGSREIDFTSDIYSLGCVVYEMLAGAAPFSGATPQLVMAARFSRTPRPISSIRNDVPDFVIAAIDKSMALKPAARWQNVGDFAAALALVAEKK